MKDSEIGAVIIAIAAPVAIVGLIIYYFIHKKPPVQDLPAGPTTETATSAAPPEAALKGSSPGYSCEDGVSQALGGIGFQIDRGHRRGRGHHVPGGPVRRAGRTLTWE